MHSRLVCALPLLPALLRVGMAQSEGSTEVPATNDEAGVSVLAVFVIMLVIGVASYHVLSFTRIPYTAILIVSLEHRTLLRNKGCGLFEAEQSSCKDEKNPGLKEGALRMLCSQYSSCKMQISPSGVGSVFRSGRIDV